MLQEGLRQRQVKGRRRLLAGVVGVLLLPLVIRYGPLLFDQMHLVEVVQSHGLWGYIIFLLLHIVATMLGVPGVILTIVGGILFGLLWGSVLSLVGATLGALGAFWMARYLFLDWAQKRVRDRKLLCSFNQAVLQHPFSFVLIVRFAPISPFNLVNFLFGMTTIHWFPYSLGTLIGIIPGVIAYTWIGVAGNEAMHGKGPWPLVIACTCLAILSAMPLLLRQKRSFN
ncbi:TVP38/TMEM64 family protein [Acaryochloris sp. 'Moss Beach']|uniref:TVP38/TMEM64 family protein n=1 Tax=Acaryochloris TaxID=155977 RepID=UPI001BB05629|nr:MULTISPECIES: TVP38/TMEM64 family protein [Acaryochloris]QUY44324.1 TVP38/TMEM64 family protein [Acaryochloris marina S15]UJB69062.1 TVP38/TMEM64 family protein [Acaryochloris sp. 'Moss Beach']